MVDARNQFVNAKRRDEPQPVGAPIRAARIVCARHVQIDQRDGTLQEFLQPSLGVRFGDVFADSRKCLRGENRRHQCNRVRAEGNASGQRRTAHIMLPRGVHPVDVASLLHPFEPHHDFPYAPPRDIDDRHLLRHLEEVTDRRPCG